MAQEQSNPTPSTQAAAEPVRSSHAAMAATFEILIDGQDPTYARQAAEACWAEVDLIETKLSRFLDGSDVSQINHLNPRDSIVVSEYTIECLTIAAQVSKDTGGAFDVTVGPLMKCWRNKDGSPRQPSDAELAEARAKVGMELVELDPANHSVRVKTAGVLVDLGAIGKGYALARMALLLKEWDIEQAFLSAAGSTVFALDAPTGKPGWPTGVGGVASEPDAPFVVQLANEALSGSAVHLKGRHIMNPKTGQPVENRLAAWSMCKDPARADALSTAFIVMDPPAVEAYCAKNPGISAMLAIKGATETDIQRPRFGPWPTLAPNPDLL